jgi:hypothetical protein
MEISNFEESKEIINNEVCFINKYNYSSKKLFENPSFLKWWNEEIRKKGKEGILKQCEECNIFCYLNKNIRSFRCQKNHYFIPTCIYCGCTFSGDCYCCIKRSLESDFGDYLLDGFYSCNINQTNGIIECIKAAPFIFNLVFAGSLYFGLFFHRKIKVDEKLYSSYEKRETFLSKASVIIAIMFFLVHSVVYFFPFIIIYLIYLIIFFKGYKHKMEIDSNNY